MIATGRVGLAALGVLAIGLAGADQARAAATCETMWLLPSDGSWSDPLKWSNGVPSAADPLRDLACITADGTYTVTINGAASAAGLTLGGATGTQTLEIVGTNAQGNATLSLGTAAGSEGVHARGVVELTDIDSGSKTATLTITSGTLANAGTINATGPAVDVSAGTRFLNGNVLNTGTIHVNATTLKQTSPGATWTNKGMLLVDSTGSQLFLESGTNFVQEAGQVLAFDQFRQDGGSFTQTGGMLDGRLEFANVTISPSGGVGTDQLYLTGTCVLASDVGEQQELRVLGGLGPNPGDAKLRLLASRSNDGTIVLDSTNGSHASTLAIENGILTNLPGAHVTSFGNTPRSIDGNFLNEGTLMIDTGTVVQHTAGASWTNNGFFYIWDGGTLDLGSATFTNQSGSTLSGGTYQLLDDSVLKYAGANVVTNSALVHLGRSSIQNSSGADALLGLTTITTDASLTLDGRSLTTTGPVSNSGFVWVGSGGTLRATGDYTQTAGSTTVFGQLAAAGGKVELVSGQLTGSGTIGSPLANSGGTVKPKSSSIGQPGTLSVTGAYTQGAAGTLVIEILHSWPSWSLLAVSGPASLGGTLALNVSMIAGTNPIAILTSSQRNGVFATTTATGGGPSHVTYDATKVWIDANQPTAERLRSFSVRRVGGSIVVRWRTAAENGVLGFHVYRELHGERVRVSGLIRAHGGPRGYAYSWRGPAPRAGRTRYRLAAVRADGSRRWLATGSAAGFRSR